MILTIQIAPSSHGVNFFFITPFWVCGLDSRSDDKSQASGQAVLIVMRDWIQSLTGSENGYYHNIVIGSKRWLCST
jgi:hypothetical protein